MPVSVASAAPTTRPGSIPSDRRIALATINLRSFSGIERFPEFS